MSYCDYQVHILQSIVLNIRNAVLETKTEYSTDPNVPYNGYLNALINHILDVTDDAHIESGENKASILDDIEYFCNRQLQLPDVDEYVDGRKSLADDILSIINGDIEIVV